MIPNGALQAGVQVTLNGIGNVTDGQEFFDNWYWSAGMGFASGAISGYGLAKENGLNIWTGKRLPPEPAPQIRLMDVSGISLTETPTLQGPQQTLMEMPEVSFSPQSRSYALARSAEREYINYSTKWYSREGPQCNIFVHDMMAENGMNPTGRALSAGTWGTKSSNIRGWSVVSDGSIIEGDIAAYKANYSNATGHMGIMVNNGGMKIVYAGSSQVNHITGTPVSWWMGKPNSPNWVVWRYIGR
jgi:hypothetical protein